MASSIQSICVFCGARSGKISIFEDTAKLLGEALANKKLKLVYGGGNLGLMGVVAKATHSNGGQVLGVLPRALNDSGIVGVTPEDNKIFVDSMHERKATMHDHADAFIALPGGYGTLEEFFEVVTWAQLKIHKKPIGLLNLDGFYNPLLGFLDSIVEKEFMTTQSRNLFVVESDVTTLLDRLLGFTPVTDPTADLLKWSTGESSKRKRIE